MSTRDARSRVLESERKKWEFRYENQDKRIKELEASEDEGYLYCVTCGPNQEDWPEFGPVEIDVEAYRDTLARVAELEAALRVCEQDLSDIVYAADNGEPYSLDELAAFKGTAMAHAALAKAEGA